jgi:putative phosphoribosyl transferase
VVASETALVLRAEVDDLVYIHAPERFIAVGLWFERFEQTTDEEVVSLLAQARQVLAGRDVARPQEPDEVAIDPPPVEEREVTIPAGDREIRANLAIPPAARGIVVFAHGSGSSRFGPRNLHVARALRDAGLATLLVDLLTADEEGEDQVSGRLRFHIDFLAERLVSATRFVLESESTGQLRVGFFGASTGAAAALVAAAELPSVVAAVVSRGGRPDLAGPSVLRRVSAPTLLIVGGKDTIVLDLNRAALQQLAAEKKLVVVPGASHLFEEPGRLDVVADLAAGWFSRHLARPQEAIRPEAQGDMSAQGR